MPSGRVSPVTLPKSVSTHTFPVGIEVMLAISRKKITIAAAIHKILRPAPRKLGMPAIPPLPKSNPPRVTFAIFPSVSRPAKPPLLRTATIPQDIVCFSLDTTGFPRHNPRQQVVILCDRSLGGRNISSGGGDQNNRAFSLR